MKTAAKKIKETMSTSKLDDLPEFCRIRIVDNMIHVVSPDAPAILYHEIDLHNLSWQEELETCCDLVIGRCI